MSIRSAAKEKFEKIKGEDEQWKSDYHFLSEDEYEAEELEEEFLKLEDIHENSQNYDVSTDQYLNELLEFIEGDFIKFLKREKKELEKMSGNPEKVYRRADDITKLIDIIDTVLEYALENNLNLSEETKKERKKLDLARFPDEKRNKIINMMKDEHETLNQLEDIFWNYRTKAEEVMNN